MSDLSTGSIILVAVVAVFTAVAAICDIRTRRIPNKLTLPVFAAGWIFQIADRGWTGLGDAALGFLVGFGVLFLLWIVGGGGGGDVKLMGALSVWLGFRLTVLVMVITTFLVLVVTSAVMVWSVLSRGLKKSKAYYLATGKLSTKEVRQGKTLAPETSTQKQQRRVMAYAVPVALATWLVIAWKYPTLDNPVRGQAVERPAAVERLN